tara:strand:- start:660 stop:1727 length:1068 start_codon:yes stop_codon:yes gene_type:complete
MGDGIKASLRERESPLMKNPLFPTNIVPPGEGKINVAGKSIPIIPKSAMSKQNIEFAKNNQIPKQDAKPSDPIVMGGSGTQQADDMGFMQKLANMANVDFDKAAATWKDKGGFEGLMSNPAFTIGLAFLQAGAEGKSLGQGALDNVIKAGAVSQQYKKIIESRKQAPIQATAADISETKSLLSKIGISEGNWFENFGSKVKNFFGKGGSRTPGLDFDRAVEEIAVQYQAAIAKKQAELKRAGKPTIIRKDDKLKILEKLIKSGVIQKNESFLSRLGITDATIQKREHGGPVHEDKSYLVGEKGPEVFIPKETGEVVANDDTQVFSMLLAANPQLQKVSKERAMKILKAKFPEYFD